MRDCRRHGLLGQILLIVAHRRIGRRALLPKFLNLRKVSMVFVLCYKARSHCSQTRLMVFCGQQQAVEITTKLCKIVLLRLKGREP